jgi:hypothetical protein
MTTTPSRTRPARRWLPNGSVMADRGCREAAATARLSPSANVNRPCDPETDITPAGRGEPSTIGRADAPWFFLVGTAADDPGIAITCRPSRAVGGGPGHSFRDSNPRPIPRHCRACHRGRSHSAFFARPGVTARLSSCFDQWETCVQYGPCARVGAPFGGGKQPAINVSWGDAQVYVNG